MARQGQSRHECQPHAERVARSRRQLAKITAASAAADLNATREGAVVLAYDHDQLGLIELVWPRRLEYDQRRARMNQVGKRARRVTSRRSAIRQTKRRLFRARHAGREARDRGERCESR
jgi:hypothetical protein